MATCKQSSTEISREILSGQPRETPSSTIVAQQDSKICSSIGSSASSGTSTRLKMFINYCLFLQWRIELLIMIAGTTGGTVCFKAIKNPSHNKCRNWQRFRKIRMKREPRFRPKYKFLVKIYPFNFKIGFGVRSTADQRMQVLFSRKELKIK